jgi:oligoribonuclease
MAKSAKYIVLDLETTGLCSVTDRILEVAAIAVAEDLTIISKFESVVGHIATRAPESVCSTPYVQDMHTRNGLLADCKAAHESDEDYTWSTVSARLYNWLWLCAPVERGCRLVGNSVHFDRQFLWSRAPQVDKHLHHQHIDVSCLINTMNLVDIPFTRVAASTHRAMAEAQASYDTWVEILSALHNLKTPGGES